MNKKINKDKKQICSVILPVYNSERYLNRTITSILQQTVSQFELLAIDDRCADNSEKYRLNKVEEKRILYCASTTNHLKNFHLPYIEALAQEGYQVTTCTESKELLLGATDFFIVPFCKSFFSLKNIQNIFRLHNFLKRDKFCTISVHTTLAAFIVRMAVFLLPKKQRPKVFYTCHGYLFSNKDGWHKWKYLIPEKMCAAVTDVLMVMNQEDEQLAEQYKLCYGKTYFIPGMGVDFTQFDVTVSKTELRRKNNIAKQDVLFVFAGEFSSRKNQKQLITAFMKAKNNMPYAKLILAGQGTLLNECTALVKQLQLEQSIYFAGYVEDISVLYQCCDVCVSSSKIEGLPFNIMEAMYCSLPCIASKVKGHEDLIQHGKTGYLYKSETEFANYMTQLYQNMELRQQLGQAAKQEVEKYRQQNVLPVIMQVYEENL